MEAVAGPRPADELVAGSGLRGGMPHALHLGVRAQVVRQGAGVAAHGGGALSKVTAVQLQRDSVATPQLMVRMRGEEGGEGRVMRRLAVQHHAAGQHIPHSGEAFRQTGRHHIHTRFHHPSREKQLLSPRIAPIAVTRCRVFAAQIKSLFRLWTGHQRHRLRFEFIQRGKLAALIKSPFQGIKPLPQ